MADPFPDIAAFFDNLAEQHGDSIHALDYGSVETQRLRFEVIAAVTDLRGKRVLDVGCGLAHYADWLDERELGVRYTGIELSPRLFELARARRPDLDLRLGNVLDGIDGEFDVVTANGIFYLMGDDALALMQAIVTSMWEHAREAVVFSSLSTWSKESTEGEFHADPIATAASCRLLTPWLTLRHDYLPHDFSIYLYRR